MPTSSQLRHALVTGASGGIGRAITLKLAASGYQLTISDRSTDRSNKVLTQLAASAKQAGSPEVTTLPVELTDATAFAEALQTLKPLSTVISCAGILRPAPLHEITITDFEHHLAVNTRSVLQLLQLAPLQDGGAFVAIGSNAAQIARVNMAAYSASKAATAALVRTAGLELAIRNIRCNVVEPGSTETPMQEDLWPDAAAGRQNAIVGDPGNYRVGIPLRRIAQAEDVAELVAFLASDAARHITMQRITIDGGASL